MGETGFSEDFKRNFLTGIAALFPILVTLVLLTWLGQQLHYTIGSRANRVCRELIVRDREVFEFFFPGAGEAESEELANRRLYAQQHFPGFVGGVLGVLAAIVAVYIIGKSLRSFVGHRAMQAVDRFFERFPVIKAIYPHARQVGDFIFGQSGKRRFSNVVAVQYPRKGVYTLGFQTGEGLQTVEDKLGRRLASVFIPTSPTPLTGFVVMVPVEEVLALEMSVDEAFRFCITAGMLSSAPRGSQRPQVASLPTADGTEAGSLQASELTDSRGDG